MSSSSNDEFEDTYDDESPVETEKHTRGGRRRAPGGGGGGGMFEVNVPNKTVGEAVEVIDKVEEPGVDAKVVEGRIADLGPDLARIQLLEKVKEPIVESPIEAVPDKVVEKVEARSK